MKIVNLLGRTFGRLTVLRGEARETPSINRPHRRRTFWLCSCTCGNTTWVVTYSLVSNRTKSCGCLIGTFHGHTTGNTETAEYRMFRHAKEHAKQRKIPFSLSITDIIIPSTCPVFGVALTPNSRRSRSSPSLDRLKPKLGYIKSNVHVISDFANRVKQDATWQEIQKVADWVKKETAYAA